MAANQLELPPTSYTLVSGGSITWMRGWSEAQVRGAIDAAVAAAVAAERECIDGLLAAHVGLSLATLDYLETMRQGPSREEWAALDANARGESDDAIRA